MKSPLKRANDIATYQLWPKIKLKDPINPEHLAKLNKFIPMYAEIIARDEEKDDRVTMPLRMSWDSRWQDHIERMKDGSA